MRDATMPTIHRRALVQAFVAISALGLLLPLTLSSRAAVVQDPRVFIGRLGAEGMAALGPAVPPQQRIARFRQLFQQDFDIGGIGGFVLGRYRWIATPQQQQDFFRLYEEYTVLSFTARLSSYGGMPFRVIGSRPYGGETVVNSEVIRPDGVPIRIEWYLTDRAGPYKVSDVVVGGVSMRVTQRNDFASWIQSNGGRFDALLAVLRQQTTQGR